MKVEQRKLVNPGQERYRGCNILGTRAKSWEASVLAIILILFGAGKLPRVMGDFAKGIKNFKAGMKDDDDLTSTPAKIEDAGEPTDRKA